MAKSRRRTASKRPSSLLHWLVHSLRRTRGYASLGTNQCASNLDIWRRFVYCHAIFTFSLSGMAWAVPADQPLMGINVEGFSDVKSETLNWDKNPFVQPLKETDVSALRVSMIVYHPDFSAALINGEVMREGDRMGAVEVVKIHPKHVILRSEDGIFRLELMRGASDREK